MAFNRVQQPSILYIDREIRLRAYDGDHQVAIPWYQDETVYYNSEGIFGSADIPDAEYVRGMYEYLSTHGELYFIEILEDGEFMYTKGGEPSDCYWCSKVSWSRYWDEGHESYFAKSEGNRHY